MKIVLLEDIEKLGVTGDVVTVKDGYARNFLIPAGFALYANPRNLKMLEAQKRVAEAKIMRELKTHKAMAMKLAQSELIFKVQTGSNEKIFGAVTSANIAQKLGERGVEIDRRIIDLPDPIKSLGVFNVPVKLHSEITAHVKVRVEKDTGDEPPQPVVEEPEQPVQDALEQPQDAQAD